MAPPTMEAVIEREYETVQKERDDLIAERDKIDEQLRALDRRLEAAANYKATLEGKFARPTAATRKPRATTGRAPSGARAKLREQIDTLIQQFPKGLSGEGINAELQATDKKTKAAIAAVLTQMKADGRILQPGGRRTLYFPAPAKRDDQAA